MRRLLPLLLLLAGTAACSPDADGDGVPEKDDCDDGDADVSPDETEVCDGKDNNCDGVIDEGVTTTVYDDRDGDGFGDASTATEACAAGADQVTNDTDCDDREETAYPGADEYCDGIDNNCNDEVDEASAVDAASWFPDGDSDGYGTDAGVIVACDPGAGYAAEGGDCDDVNDEVNPGADEVCDGVDNDCKDGIDDENALDALKWFADTDSDSFGDDNASVFACQQPDGFVAQAGDCDDTDDREMPGVMWYPDLDGDRFGDKNAEGNVCEKVDITDVTNNRDCDDADDTANPGEIETWYNGVDNDCSGGSDYDRDGDGYDSSSDGGTGEDCDDSDPNINPDEIEVDDGRDNDCDLACDEDFITTGDIVITEIMQNPLQVDDNLGEWFEVKNISSRDVTMCGAWVIKDAGTDSHTIVGPVTIKAGAYAVFGADADTTKNGGVTLDYDYSGISLANGDDEVILEFDGAVMDEVYYDGGPDFPDPNGSSMNLDPDFTDATDNDDSANWCATDTVAYGSGDLGSPGAANEDCPE